MTGIPARKLIDMVAKKAGLILTTKKIASMDRQRDEIYLKLILDEVKPLPGAIELITLLKKANIKIALASSSNKRLLDAILPKLSLTNSFETVVSGDMVPHGKPNPDIFLLASKKLATAPRDCVVIEDANAGVQAAKAAGMKVVMVENNRIFQEKQNADCFVHTLANVSVSTLMSV
jgi:beta-phosphoglucomutase